MRRIDGLWLGIVGLVGGIGAVFGVIVMPPGTPLRLIVVVAVLAGIVHLADARTAGSRRVQTRALVSAALLLPVGIVATVGLGVVLGAGAVPVIGLLAATSPAARTRYPRSTPSLRTRTSGVPTHQGALRAMSDAELRAAWRRSLADLQTARHDSERAGIVDARRGYLDEVERRNPRGFADWLQWGADTSELPTWHRTGGATGDFWGE